jgi:hypothetical protein
MNAVRKARALPPKTFSELSVFFSLSLFPTPQMISQTLWGSAILRIIMHSSIHVFYLQD